MIYALNHLFGLILIALLCFLPAILMGLYAATWAVGVFALVLGLLAWPPLHGRNFVSWGLCLYNAMLGAAIFICRLIL